MPAIFGPPIRTRPRNASSSADVMDCANAAGVVFMSTFGTRVYFRCYAGWGLGTSRAHRHSPLQATWRHGLHRQGEFSCRLRTGLISGASSRSHARDHSNSQALGPELGGDDVSPDDTRSRRYRRNNVPAPLRSKRARRSHRAGQSRAASHPRQPMLTPNLPAKLPQRAGVEQQRDVVQRGEPAWYSVSARLK